MTSKEKEIFDLTVDIYDAIEIVENYCCDNHGTCEIKKIEKINEEENIC